MTAGQKKCLQFTKKYSSDLVAALTDSNIFIATAVASKCLESGFGTAPLAKKYNNFGGIKGKPIYATGKTSSGFSIFPSPKASFMSYAYFINNLEGGLRYKKALQQTNPTDQLWWLVYAGYCPEPYPNQPAKNADAYLENSKSFINILNQRKIGGKITSKNALAYIEEIQNLEI
jgi:flagellum-specific peptidoglycan hydrolase FlgJ